MFFHFQFNWSSSSPPDSSHVIAVDRVSTTLEGDLSEEGIDQDTNDSKKSDEDISEEDGLDDSMILVKYQEETRRDILISFD